MFPQAATSETQPTVSAVQGWIFIAGVLIHWAVVCGSTIWATHEIRSILYSGWVCAGVSALLMAVAGLARRPDGVLIGASTIAFCLCLLGVEIFASLGPGGARFPFCIAFLGYQASLTIVGFSVLGESRSFSLRRRGNSRFQFSFRALVASTTALAIVFTICGYLIRAKSDPFSVASIWLTGFGLIAFTIALTHLTKPQSTHSK